MNAFLTTQVSYCPLVWMCHSPANNSKITILHERFLRIVYSDTLNELLEIYSSVSIHLRNIQILQTYQQPITTYYEYGF